MIGFYGTVHSGPLKIRLLQCYVVLWIHNIDAICMLLIQDDFEIDPKTFVPHFHKKQDQNRLLQNRKPSIKSNTYSSEL